MHGGYFWLEEPIPIIDHLNHYITQLPCKGEDPIDISEGKSSDFAIVEAMKKKYKLEKKKRDYTISSINNKAVKVVTQILASKVMRRCHANEVPTLVVALAEQCAEGVQFNWSEFLCKEFLENFSEAQEQGKKFHYAWLLLAIVLVAGELLEDSQFPTIDRDLQEAVKYTSLLATKNVNRIRDSKIFWVFMEMNIKMGINRNPWLSPIIYNSLQSIA